MPKPWPGKVEQGHTIWQQSETEQAAYGCKDDIDDIPRAAILSQLPVSNLLV